MPEIPYRRRAVPGLPRLWPVAAVLIAALAVTLVAAAGAAAATPLVKVTARLERRPSGMFVTGRVVWNQAAANRAPDHMTVGDLRVVAVSDHGHAPTLLAKATHDRISAAPIQDIDLPIRAADLHAIQPGNRVVLTASQHGVVSQGTRTARTFVTVRQLQPFGTAQGPIGRRDCASLPIVAGAELNRCDLVGAYLDRALVSVREPKGTRMLLADLTGATMRGADLTGLSVAGGRLNGADATDAVFDNVSLAGAQATGLIARDAVSDRRQASAGADLFDAQLTDAVFSGTVLKGVSLNHARLNGASFRDSTWTAVDADTANFRGADLSGLKTTASSVYFADFTDAQLQTAGLSRADLQWATLCHTQLPSGFPPEDKDRDCPVAVDPGPTPVANPFVIVSATLEHQQRRAVIKGMVRWNAAGLAFGMTAGDVRLVAIDGSTGRPTLVRSVSIPNRLAATTPFDAIITDATPADAKFLAALNRGNRVVLTATQHPPLPDRPSDRTTRSYVTVRTLQPGPRRGRVGSRDCSNIVLGPTSPGPAGYDFCDLAGAVLRQASLSGPMRDANLSGADLANAGLSGIFFDGSAMGGVVATGASFSGVHMIEALAPGLTMPSTLISGGELRALSLDEADFHGSTISDTTFAAASLRRAVFSDATFDKVDLGYTGLAKAKLDGVNAVTPDRARARRSSLFLADLTDATLKSSRWLDDEAGDAPWEWATLCATTMPAHAIASGDRDCPS